MSKQFKDLKYFKGWTLENFPFIEDDFDAITTYQFMCKIVEYLNEVIYNQKVLDENNQYIKELVDSLKAYIDEYLEDLTTIKEQIQQLENEYNSLSGIVEDHSTALVELDGKIDSSVNNLKVYTDNLVQSNYNTLKTYVDNQDAYLQYEIDNINIGATIIYDPTTGLQSTVQDVINNLYQLTNKDGITAGEFDALELTATEFDSKDITAYEFDSASKDLLTN